MRTPTISTDLLPDRLAEWVGRDRVASLVAALICAKPESIERADLPEDAEEGRA